MGLWFGTYQDTEYQWLRWYSANRQWISTHAERAEQQQYRTEQEKRIAEQERIRADEEMRRAEQERIRADEEMCRANLLQSQSEKMAEILRTLGIDPTGL
ncbi:hypothetical protein CCP3SC1_490027 [Gammaproteobacteria bacterium]